MATTDITLNSLITLVAEQLALPSENVKETSRFVDDLGADTLDVIELVMEAEEYFEVSITDDEADRCVTVGQLYQLIKSKKETKNEH